MSAGEVGEETAGFGERDGVAVAAGVVADCLRDEGFADADGSVEDDRFAGGEEPEGGEVTDRAGVGGPSRHLPFARLVHMFTDSLFTDYMFA